MAIKHSSKDPREMFPKPPFPSQQQEYPGFQSKMNPVPESGRGIYTGSGKLQDKVAIITGGDSGIGKAIATLYAKEGADVVISYLSENPDAEDTKTTVEETGRKCLAIGGDIRSEGHCKDIVQKTVDEFGKIDILINNAAYQMSHQSIDEFTEEELDNHFKSNVYPLFYFCKAAIQHMAPGSSIINTTSIQAYQPSPTLLAYAPTKAAILNFTKAYAQQAIEKGIRVNAVAPGPVWTPLIPSTMEGVENFGKQSLFKRPAQPVELAALYVFFASDEASYVTAQVYGATGEMWP
jgi:NAD(P)-dependent dehydrogenase (short-subunit alcohol dehydrogenase family)